jgi:GTP cyclohydrolase II
MQRIVAAGGGLLLYLRFDGRGAGLAAKVAATALEVEGVDTWQSRIDIGVEPEGRNFEGVANYLIERGFDEIRLMTNNPDKVCALTGQGIRVTREPLVIKHPSAHVRELYRTKADKFHHHIDLNDLSSPDVDT